MPARTADLTFPVVASATDASSACRRAAATIFDVIVKQDAILPAELGSLLGIDGSGGDNTIAVSRAWYELLKRGLITPSELASAFHGGSVRDLFTTAVTAAAVNNEPVWRKQPACAALLPHINSYPSWANADAASAQLRVATVPAKDMPTTDDDLQLYRKLLQHTTAAKDAGNAHYSANRYEEALGSYEEAISTLGPEPFILKDGWSLASILHSNIAQVYICKEEWAAARRSAAAALKYNADNEKASRRKALAEEQLMSQLGSIEKEARKSDLKEMCSQQ
jgi:tetratricopeptide (TPR) repeat protein